MASSLTNARSSGVPSGCRPTTPTSSVLLLRRGQRQHPLGVGEQDARPARPVVGPGVIDHLVAGDPQQRADGGQRRVVQRPGADQGRRGEGETPVDPAQLDEPRGALLHELIAVAVSLEPRVSRAEGRVAREGQLARGGEDPHPVVGAGLGRLEQEGCL